MTDVKVSGVMTHLVVMLYPNDSVHEAERKLARNHISGAPVVEGGKVTGIVSESDLIKAALSPTPAETVTEVMNSKVVKVSPTTSVWEAASIMQARGVKRLPVVDEEGYLLGIVSRADLIKAMAEDDSQVGAHAP